MLCFTMRGRLHCLAKALEMDAQAAVSDTDSARPDYAILAEGWRSVARRAQRHEALEAALGLRRLP